MGTFDPGLTLWTLITFGILFLVLARYTFKPLGRILREREASIRKSLDEAQKARLHAQDLLIQTQAQLERSRDEARRIIDESQRIAAEARREALHAARQEASEILVQSRADIQRELWRGVEELKETVATLAVRVSREAIRRQVDESIHRDLTKEFLDNLRKKADEPAP